MLLKMSSATLIAMAVLALALVVPATAADRPTTAPAQTGRLFEMRKYYAMPGKMDALNARFRNHTCALFEKHGMQLIGFWEPTEGAEAGRTLVYLLAFSSKEAKDAAWKGYSGDPEWKKARDESEKDGKLVEKIESTLMKATDYSAIR